MLLFFCFLYITPIDCSTNYIRLDCFKNNLEHNFKKELSKRKGNKTGIVPSKREKHIANAHRTLLDDFPEI